MIHLKDHEIAEGSTAVIAAAAGWLAGRAEQLLGDRSYVERTVAALTDTPCRIDFAFLHQLEADIRACIPYNIPPPKAEDFFGGMT
jgi:hypothetical protein